MKLYNSKTRTKEEFVPIEANKVKMYNCGPTVYNYFHIGNARNFVVFDTLRKYFIYRGYEVTFVQNFTDIDDRMITQSINDNITVKELADKYIKEYFTDARGLRIMEADFHPRATENISEIIKLIKKIQANGYAYEVEGDVYFDTSAYKNYGKLSGHKLDELEAGARVQTDGRKKNPADFALWKTAKPGEPFWGSPWGKGRPGWHIECSAMSMKHLGDTFDIHSGGKDLLFPHHENEVAQSESATGKTFVNYWLHNGFINVDSEKMSKSLGNFFTVRDVVKLYTYEEIRFFLLSAQYRSPVNFSDTLMEQSKNGLVRIYESLKNLAHIKNSEELQYDEKQMLISIDGFKTNFITHMNDDLNTADAIADIFDIVKEVNTALAKGIIKTTKAAGIASGIIRELGNVLGILQKDIDVEITPEIQELIDKRIEARKSKDFAASDELRDKLKDLGILIEDTKDGYKVKYL
ncbi:MAG: cysteine--tRNA ligase [Clostridiales bacterium]|nr:cysteine--tRNA ligase [Clostridiales bacterium]